MIDSSTLVEPTGAPPAFKRRRPALITLAALLLLFAGTFLAWTHYRDAHPPIVPLPPLPAVASTAELHPLPQKIAPRDPAIHLMGRVQWTPAGHARLAWPGTAVAFHFRGRSLDVHLQDAAPEDFFQVVIDGDTHFVLKTDPQHTRYHLANFSPGEHTLWLYKRTEGNLSTAEFAGFELPPDARPLPFHSTNTHRIEFIGDSITCGNGIEATNPRTQFSPAIENNYLSYASITARNLNAEYQCLAYSGLGVGPAIDLRPLLQHVLPSTTSPRFASDAWKPDLIFINLGTNDFPLRHFTRNQYIHNMIELVRTLQRQQPQAVIYLATGPMVRNEWFSRPLDQWKSALNLVAQATSTPGHPIHRIDFPPQDPRNGYGGNWHPSLRTHELMAAQLTHQLQHDLGWQPKPNRPVDAPAQIVSND